jgi:hypothetical protein
MQTPKKLINITTSILKTPDKKFNTPGIKPPTPEIEIHQNNNFIHPVELPSFSTQTPTEISKNPKRNKSRTFFEYSKNPYP